MLNNTTRFFRISAYTVVFSLLHAYAGASIGSVTRPYLEQKAAEASAKRTARPSVILRTQTMRGFFGKAATNPYAAGQAKWDVVHKGVNLRTGNFSTSGTDLTFEGGYGIPINVTRSYSANSAEEGPLGIGWNLSVDVRSTAGGILKSKGASVRTVPISFKNRPAGQVDPNVVQAKGSFAQPPEAVLSTDAGGEEETIQIDADGILSTPPWDKNTHDTVWETKVIGGSTYRLMVHNVTRTAEGTTYSYDKKGEYINGGMKRYNDNSPDPVWEPSNVLKIVNATDRHGNVTNYSYSSAMATFSKINGVTSENKLQSISMPNGHQINFTWTGNRVTQASDGVRNVNYGYTNGWLTSVTTPGGKTTQYEYGGADFPVNWSGEQASGLLTRIKDPRGLNTDIHYFMHPDWQWPVVGYVHAPNGISTKYGWGFTFPGDSYATLPGSVVDYVQANGHLVGGLMHYEATYGPNLFWVGLATCNESFPIARPIGSGVTNRFFSRVTQDLLHESTITPRMSLGGYVGSLRQDRLLDYPATNFEMVQRVSVDKTYNFMGNPLASTMRESHSTTTSTIGQPFTNWVETRQVVSDTAYWGADKYYQKKADKVNDGTDVRYSFTDYYLNIAVAGKRGQTYRVYDGKRATFSTDHAGQPDYPPGTNGSYWRYDIHVVDPTKYSAQFDYDTQGRPVDVWKIQDTSVTPWKYVQTHTNYGSPNSPTWGAATDVWEDYGSGKINRHTQTTAYDSIGRAIEVTDASGKTFHTYYDNDGVIQSIAQINGSNNTPVVTYTYGTTPYTITYGAVLSVVDNISGRTQTMSYYTNPSDKFSLGQVASVVESGGNAGGAALPSYTTSYTYNEASERATATYATPDGTNSWGYTDYVPVGDPTKGARAFQTMRKLDANGNPTAEEFHYEFDAMGRLKEAAFAQTPKDGWTPSGSNPWYDATHRAKTRARAHFIYDDGGRPLSVEYLWDTINTAQTEYTSTFIRGNTATYELSGLNRGLKLSSAYWVPSANGPVTQRTENFGYDANLDYLTSANYGDGLANQNVTWTYDAAGNRASDSSQSGAWTYDNLNRMSASPSATYSNDILGNRLSKTGSGGPYATHSMTWDILNRMTGYSGGGTTTAYTYRADGMRTSKSVGTALTKYRYDGQMGIQDVENTVVTNYGLGARGIDVILRTESGSTAVGYPVYDLHGNMVATIAKSGSGWSIGNERSFDAWGNVRSGSGVNTGRYCANLGHKQDDESGLTYMRARYYEGASGRFVSEDKARDGSNILVYCKNNPIGAVDRSGNECESEKILMFLMGVFLLVFGMVCLYGNICDIASITRDITYWASKAASNSAVKGFGDVLRANLSAIDQHLSAQRRQQFKQGAAAAGSAILAIIGYDLILRAYLLDCQIGPDGPGIPETVFGGGDSSGEESGGYVRS